MRDINDIIQRDYPENYWDFKGVTKKGVHTLGKYPATMVADMQYELVKILSERFDDEITLLDPFCGSGTSLVVSKTMEFSSIGIDINPYAILLSEVKTKLYKYNEVENACNSILERLDSPLSCDIFEFEKINKWFRKDIIESLSKIRACIVKEKNIEIRKFFWICFSEILFKFSNDRSSTFKLHVLTEDKINSIQNTCIADFKDIIFENSKVLNYSNNTFSMLLQGDCIQKMIEIPKHSISIICTSPPYGDNATTVTYGQFSILALKWIDEKDLKNDNNLMENYSKIDRLSLGGMSREEFFTKNIKSVGNYLSMISDNKKKKIINFFEDYYLVFKAMEKVLVENGYLLMTVGNRRVDGFVQPLDKISIEIANSMGFKTVTEFDRKILSKNMPFKVSHILDKGAVNSMTEETVLIFKK